MIEWEEKYNDLMYAYKQRGYKIEELEEKITELSISLNSAEHRIAEELTPLLKSKADAYDNFVTEGSGDECFRNGINGNCGDRCEAFGSKDECGEEKIK